MKDYSHIAIIGDADTIEGFEIAGMANRAGLPTVLEVTRTDTAESIAAIFQEQIKRKDIAIIFICDFASQKIQQQISKHRLTLPSVLVIPSKNKAV